MANPTTTAPPVNFNSTAWFATIIRYLEVKSLALWFDQNPNASYESFEAAWPLLLDQMMRNATRTCIADLGRQNLIQPN